MCVVSLLDLYVVGGALRPTCVILIAPALCLPPPAAKAELPSLLKHGLGARCVILGFGKAIVQRAQFSGRGNPAFAATLLVCASPCIYVGTRPWPSLLAALGGQVGRGWASQLRCGRPVDE